MPLISRVAPDFDGVRSSTSSATIGSAHRIADEEDAVGANGQRAGGFEIDFTGRHIDGGGEGEYRRARGGRGKPDALIGKVHISLQRVSWGYAITAGQNAV